jgi:large subunit ribosomal protein L35
MKSPKQRSDEMPKMKTHRGSAKRFTLTGTGKLKRNKANKQHILTKKRTKLKRHLRKSTLVAADDVARVRRLLPYL